MFAMTNVIGAATKARPIRVESQVCYDRDDLATNHLQRSDPVYMRNRTEDGLDAVTGQPAQLLDQLFDL